MSRRQAFTAFAGVMLGMLLAALDQTIVATALPRIVADLHGLGHLSWVVTAYLVTSTVTVPLYGKLSDLYGRKRLFTISIVVFLVGSALCGSAQSMTELILYRGLQGLGAGGLIPLALAVIGDLFSPRERGRYQGYTGAVWATAAVAGPLLGGVLTDSISWRWIFYINLPVGVLALVVVARTMHVPFLRREHRIDYLGALTLTAAAVCLLLACVWGGVSYPWSSPEVVGLFAGGAALLLVFVGVELRAAEPILPLRLFRSPVYSVANAAALLIGAALFGSLIYIPLFVQGVIGSSATNAGVVLIPLMLGWVVTSVVSGQIISRTGRYRVFPIGGTLLLLLGFWLLTRMGAHTTDGEAVRNMLVIGFGMGLTYQTYLIAVQNAVEPRDLGIATASVQFFRSIGGTFAVAAFGTILTTRLSTELPRQLGAAAGTLTPTQLLQSPAAVRALPPHLVAGVRDALSLSLHSVFLVCVPLVGAALLVALLLEERPLRSVAPVETHREAGSPTESEEPAATGADG